MPTKQHKKPVPKRQERTRHASRQESFEEHLMSYNDVLIPAVPATLGHAVLCAMADSKNRFARWDKLYRLASNFLVQYGGEEAAQDADDAWKSRVRSVIRSMSKIPAAKGSMAWRLHEHGMAVVVFADGAVLRVNGWIDRKPRCRRYVMAFPDGTVLEGNQDSELTYRRFKEMMSQPLESEGLEE